MSRRVNETLDLGNAAKIINLPAPTSANDAARKADVDAIQTTLSFMEAPVRAVAVANVNTSSPGATIDSVSLAAGDRVLLTGQTTTSQNGTWVWHGATSAMTRTTDSFVEGTVVFADADGAVYGDTLWIETTSNPVPGTSAMTFLRLPFEAITAGTGLTRTGNVLALSTPVSVANGGTGAASVAAAKAALGFSTTYEQDFGNGAASSFTITHNLGNQYCSVVVVNKSTGQDEDCTITRIDANSLSLSAEGWAVSPPATNAYHVACRG